MRHLLLLATAAFVLRTVSLSSQPTLRVEVEILGSVPGYDHTFPAAINDDGVVVGSAEEDGVSVAFIWTRAAGFRVIANDAFAADINNRGDVVGTDCEDNGSGCRGFVWNAQAGFRYFDDFFPSAINDNGDMAGGCADTNGACAVRQDQVDELWKCDDLCSVSARAINAAGDVVGSLIYYDEEFNIVEESAELWTRDGRMLSLGCCSAEAINDAGTVAGRSAMGASLWTSQGIQEIPDTEAGALLPMGINNRGWMVGIRYIPPNRAFFWDSSLGSSTLDLAPQFGSSYALDINERGEILGVAGEPEELQPVIWRLTSSLPLHIDTPNTPSRWGLNTRQRLAWTYEGDAPQFLIEISRDSGDTWTELATVPNRDGNSQNFYWTVTGPLTSAAKFRVTAIGDPEATDINDTDIRIANATIEILTPKEATSVTMGSPFTISYKHSLGAGAPVVIEVSSDNGRSWRTLVETTTRGSTTSSFVWSVDLLPTTAARVRINALDGSGARSAWSRPFTVTAPE